MASDVKFAVFEIDGEEFGQPIERRAIAEEVYEDITLSRRVIDIIHSLPHVIGAGREVILGSDRQIWNIDGLEIKGQLTITGSLVI